jgi:putative phage-type endonuclease
MIQQRTQEWFDSRIGKLTGSIAFDAISFLTNGKDETQARANLRLKVVAERLTGISPRFFINKSMQWGVDNEDYARFAYESTTGNKVEDAPFFDCPDIPMCGASPDGLVGKNGLIEIKCPETNTFISYVLANEVPEKYKPQMAMQLIATGRKWVDFVAFDPRIKNGIKIFIKRYHPTEDELNDYRSKFRSFLSTVDEMQETFLNKNNEVEDIF